MSALNSGTARVGPIAIGGNGSGTTLMTLDDPKMTESPRAIKVFSANAADTAIGTGNIVASDIIYAFWSYGVLYAINLSGVSIDVEIELNFEIDSANLSKEYSQSDVDMS